MQNIFVEFLPPWVETGLQPAFYDKESGTVLQQVARMYAKVNYLIKIFNDFSKDTTDFVNDFVDSTNTEITRFENAVDTRVTNFENSTTETVNDYIARFVALKDFVDDYFDNLDVQEEINNKLDDMADQGILQEIITTYIQSNVAWTFDNVAEMKLATNLIAGSYAQTLGYHTIGDGGGATYYITDTGTANEEDVIAVGSLYANLVLPDRLTPQMFGAYGDGTHDDTSIIQDCIDFVSGKPVKLLLDREYLVTPATTLTNERKIAFKLKSNIVIEGNGFESGLIIDDTNANIYWAVFYADNDSGALENISLENFKIYQNDNNLADIEVTTNNPRYIFYTSYGITNYTINHILFDHVYSRDVIMMTSGEISSNVQVTNCIINYFNVLDRVTVSDCTAIFLNCKNYTVSDNILYGANFTCKGGIEIHGHDGTADNNKIIGFIDCMHVQPSGTGAANFTVTNNYMYGNDGINLWDSSQTSPSTVGLQNVIINNNFILVSATGADTQYNGIRFSSSTFTHPVTGLIIKNNTIDFTNITESTTIAAAYSGGITLNNSSASINDMIIENNIITNSVSSGIFVGSTSGTATTTHENIIIRGNIIKDNSKVEASNPFHNSTIVLYNKYLKSIVVDNNMLINNIVDGGAAHAFFAGGTSVEGYPCYFRDNIVKSVNSGDMTVDGISTWIYKNDKQIPIFSPNGTKYYIKVANDGTLSAS